MLSALTSKPTLLAIVGDVGVLSLPHPLDPHMLSESYNSSTQRHLMYHLSNRRQHSCKSSKPLASLGSSFQLCSENAVNKVFSELSPN